MSHSRANKLFRLICYCQRLAPDVLGAKWKKEKKKKLISQAKSLITRNDEEHLYFPGNSHLSRGEHEIDDANAAFVFCVIRPEMDSQGSR